MNINKTIKTAVEYQRAGKLEQAASLYKKILKKQPDHAEVLHLLGVLYSQAENYDAAIDCLKKSLRHTRGHFILYYNLGNAFQKKGDVDQAIHCFQEALQLNPNVADVHYNLGIAFQISNRIDDAIASFRKALNLNPALFDAYYNLGNALQDKGDRDEAIVCYQKSIQLNPGFAGNFCNLGNILKEKGRFEEAIEYYQKALLLNPNIPEVLHNLGTIHQEKGRLEEAIRWYRQAVRHRLDFTEAHWNLSQALLSSADLVHGWREYEWRWQVEDFRRCSFPQPRWDGSSLERKWIFIYLEQGVGDEIMFASCFPEVISQSAQCIIECDGRLIPLFSRSFPRSLFTERIDNADQMPAELLSADFRVPAGSLPGFLRPSLNHFPRQKSYLIPDIHKAELWRQRYNDIGRGKKVGISWRGGKYQAAKVARSTSLLQWKELFSIPEVHFINLQYGDCTGDLREARETLGVTI
ncbi:MAG: tetratricopeptide repeat protein, partial [Nitrospirota bacterium]